MLFIVTMIENFMDTSEKNKLFNTIPVNEKTSANLKTERKNKIIERKKQHGGVIG